MIPPRAAIAALARGYQTGRFAVYRDLIEFDIVQPSGMRQLENKPRLIGDWRSALIVACLTGVVAALSVRSAFSSISIKPHWHGLIPLDSLPLPIWAMITINAVFYVYFLWAGAALYRRAQRNERIVVAGWFAVFLLIPVQTLVSTRQASAIQWIKGASMTAAFVTAVHILLKSPPATHGISAAAKRRLLALFAVLAAVLILGALLYFVPLQ